MVRRGEGEAQDFGGEAGVRRVRLTGQGQRWQGGQKKKREEGEVAEVRVGVGESKELEAVRV